MSLALRALRRKRPQTLCFESVSRRHTGHQDSRPEVSRGAPILHYECFGWRDELVTRRQVTAAIDHGHQVPSHSRAVKGREAAAVSLALSRGLRALTEFAFASQARPVPRPRRLLTLLSVSGDLAYDCTAHPAAPASAHRPCLGSKAAAMWHIYARARLLGKQRRQTQRGSLAALV